MGSTAIYVAYCLNSVFNVKAVVVAHSRPYSWSLLHAYKPSCEPSFEALVAAGIYSGFVQTTSPLCN